MVCRMRILQAIVLTSALLLSDTASGRCFLRLRRHCPAPIEAAACYSHCQGSHQMAVQNKHQIRTPAPPPPPVPVADSGVQIDFYVRSATCHQLNDMKHQPNPYHTSNIDEIYFATTVGSLITREDGHRNIFRNQTLPINYHRQFPMGEGEGGFLLHLREHDDGTLQWGDENLGDAYILLSNRGNEVTARLVEKNSNAVASKGENTLTFSGDNALYTVTVEIIVNSTSKIPLGK